MTMLKKLKNEDGDPLVSVFIPSFNHGRYIEKCILSIINQDYLNIELIIIDDGSKDESIEIIDGLRLLCEKRFPNFKFISRDNKGLSYSMNEGLTLSSGKYFLAIASDDAMLKCRISKQVYFLEKNPAVDCVFGSAIIIDSNSNKIGEIRKSEGLVYFSDLMLLNKSLLAPTFFGKTCVIRSVGGYPAGLYIEDWYMWLKISQMGFVIYQMSDFFAEYRSHDSNISKNLEKMDSSRKQILSQFKDSIYFEDAMSILDIQYAVDLLAANRGASLAKFFKVITRNPKIILQLKTLHYIIRFITPYSLYSKVKSWRKF